jgi:16S rRNA (cytosine1402-N4)-methyltransferase
LDFVHQTVLLREAVALLAPGAGKVIVDATLGGGGHAEALLREGATLIGVDRDERALAAASARLSSFGPSFRPVRGNFGDLEEILASVGTSGVDGVLLDLGVSSPQLDEASRGFSFQKDGPLDMRMGDEPHTAAELIADTDEAELADILHTFGEEPFARRIARALKAALPQRTLETAEIVGRAVPRKAWPKRVHVATRTFQALRMAVNRELESLDRFLSSLPRILNIHGVAAIISFHSLEDRKVKEAFAALEGRCTCPPGLPVCVCGARGSFSRRTRKAVVASEEEVARNPRARSARLRAVEKMQ